MPKRMINKCCDEFMTDSKMFYNDFVNADNLMPMPMVPVVKTNNLPQNLMKFMNLC